MSRPGGPRAAQRDGVARGANGGSTSGEKPSKASSTGFLHAAHHEPGYHIYNEDRDIYNEDRDVRDGQIGRGEHPKTGATPLGIGGATLWDGDGLLADGGTDGPGDDGRHGAHARQGDQRPAAAVRRRIAQRVSRWEGARACRVHVGVGRTPVRHGPGLLALRRTPRVGNDARRYGVAAARIAQLQCPDRRTPRFVAVGLSATYPLDGLRILGSGWTRLRTSVGLLAAGGTKYIERDGCRSPT